MHLSSRPVATHQVGPFLSKRGRKKRWPPKWGIYGSQNLVSLGKAYIPTIWATFSSIYLGILSENIEFLGL